MPARSEPVGHFPEPLDGASDEALARRVQHGDRLALEHLVRRYVRAIHAIAATSLSEAADVEDAAQETFLRVVRGIEAYDAGRPFAPWLYQIARNVVRNQLDAGARWRMEVLPETVRSTQPGPDVLLARSEMRGRVDAAVRTLPEQQRTAFLLSDVEGHATGEVAQMMCLAPGTVRSHVHHARKALRVALADAVERIESSGGA